MIEQRLRESLQDRAGDVEPTPALQLAVERRIGRRRRRRAAGGSLAAAAAVVAAIAIVPGILEQPERDVGIAPGQESDPQADAEDGGEPGAGEGGRDGGAGEDEAATMAESGDDAATDRAPLEGVDGLTAVGFDELVAGPAVEVAGRELRLREGGAATTLDVLPAEGGSTWQSIAVHPDSTPGDLLVAGVTMAEGMLDLRLLRVRDGEVVARHVADEPPRTAGATGGGPDQARPVFSPDGQAVALLEAPSTGEEGPVLRVHRLEDPFGQPALGAPDRTPLALPGPDWVAQTWAETELGDHQLRLAGAQAPAHAVAVTVTEQGIDVRQSFPLEPPEGSARVRASTRLGQVVGERAEWQPSSRPTADQRAALADVGGLDAGRVQLGPTVGEVAVLRAGGAVYALGVERIARWPGAPADAALLPGG